MERPTPPPPESLHLQYEAGWHEILHAPDAADYRQWLQELTELTRLACVGAANSPAWAAAPEQIQRRWQRAIELIGEASIDPEDVLTDAERLEAAILTLKELIKDPDDWEEDGLRFYIFSVYTGEESIIDLREVTDAPDESI